MIPDPEKVRVWEARAPAYDRLCRRWEVFSQLSNRLIDLLPADLHGPVLDIGAGSGLTSELLLARHPDCEAILIEPSEAMLAIARRHLAGRRAQFFGTGLDAAPVRDLHAVAAVASASMQFLEFDPAFGRLAEAIPPGGYVAFNLWWHHWEETADIKWTVWEAIARDACLGAGLPPPDPPAAGPPKAKTRVELTNATSRHGFELVFKHRDEDSSPVSYGVDFAAMDTHWPLKGIGPETRQALLTKMHELAQGRFDTLVSTRFLFRKTDDRR